MMEEGKLLATEVLPKVSSVFRKFARDGGALAKALENVRVQQGKFTLELQNTQDTIFKSGFGKGFAELLKELSIRLKDLKPAAKTIGAIFKVVFDGIRAASSFLITPIETLGRLAEVLGLNNKLGEIFSSQFVPKMVAAAVLLRTTFGKYLVILEGIVAVLEEILALSTKGVMAEIERRMGKDIGSEDLGRSLGFLTRPQTGERSLSQASSDVAAAAGMSLATGGMWNIPSLARAIAEAVVERPMNVVTNVNVDEYGSATANSQIAVQAANAQRN